MPSPSRPRFAGLRRWSGLGLACALGALAIFGLLDTASAQAPRAKGHGPQATTVWLVNNTPGDGLVAYWKFDQFTGTTTLNSAVLTNTTTLVNGASITTGVPVSVTVPDFGALLLDGVNDAATVADATALDVSPSSFSVAAWVRRVITGTSTGDLIYDSGTQTNHWFFGFLSDDKLTFTTNGAVDYRSNFTVTDPNWHHVAAVVNGSGAGNLVIYLDGVASPPLTATIAFTPSGPKLIGNKNGSLNTPFSGSIDELRLYNRALSAAELVQLAAGRGCATDGLSWATAFTDLQCALDVAASGDEVWVSGSPQPYRPGSARAAGFNLADGVGVFGGFAGTEIARSQRPLIDFTKPFSDSAASTLSGDLFGDDAGAANLGDNSFHVVTAQVTLPATTLDGFVIRAGNSNDHPGPSTLGSGGGLHISGTSPALSNLLFTNNSTDGNGGGLFATSRVTLTSVSFLSNTAEFGGGAFASQDAAVDGGLVEGNVAAPFNGGGLNVGGTLNLTGTTFVNNRAGFSGGGASALAANVVNARFEQNRTTTFGGAGLQVNGTLALTNTVFLSNTTGASGNGGGAQASQAIVSGGLFQNNQSSNSALLGGGGGLFADDVSITGATFISNATNLDGGGLAAGAFTPGTAALANTVFLSNTARHGGGLAVNGAVTVTNAVFDSNTATGLGGGMVVTGTLSFDGAQFLSNTAASGAGLGLGGGNGQLANVNFAGNQASGSGGGLLLTTGSYTVANASFAGNLATGPGGAVFNSGASLVLADSTLASNTGSSGGGLDQVTGTANVNNSILWGNLPDQVAGSLTNFSFSLVQGLPAGGGNLNSDPLFVRNPNPGDGNWATRADNDYGDLHLQLTSPAIDAGSNSLVPAGLLVDLDGHPRFIDVFSVPNTGAGTPPIVDMGAFEAGTLLRLFLPLVMR